MSEYRIEAIVYSDTKEQRYRVLAKNGKWVAECRSMYYAERVKKGLILELEHSKKMKDFRL